MEHSRKILRFSSQFVIFLFHRICFVRKIVSDHSHFKSESLSSLECVNTPETSWKRKKNHFSAIIFQYCDYCYLTNQEEEEKFSVEVKKTFCFIDFRLKRKQINSNW